MEITYTRKSNKKIEKLSIVKVHFVESEQSTMITCNLFAHDGEKDLHSIAEGKGLNAADAFSSALKDLNGSTNEINDVKISDR